MSNEELHRESERLGIWVHSPRLLGLIEDSLRANEGKELAALKRPLMAFRSGLAAIAERAAELNDPELNSLMLRMTLYPQADPDSQDYQPDLLEQLENGNDGS